MSLRTARRSTGIRITKRCAKFCQVENQGFHQFHILFQSLLTVFLVIWGVTKCLTLSGKSFAWHLCPLHCSVHLHWLVLNCLLFYGIRTSSIMSLGKGANVTLNIRMKRREVFRTQWILHLNLEKLLVTLLGGLMKPLQTCTDFYMAYLSNSL